MQEKKLKEYCIKMLLEHEIDGDILLFEDREYFIVPKDSLIFDEDFEFIPECEFDIDGYVYEFGGRWYLQDKEEAVTMTEFRHVGRAVQKLPIQSFLGIHSGSELLNGVGLYKDWIKKAKFLGIKSLGICEKNTLAGVIDFQNGCKAVGIKPVIGMTLPILTDSSDTYDIKLYVKNFQGWLSVLKFSEIINVQGKSAVSEEYLLQNLEGVIPVIDPKTTPFQFKPKIKAFYQLDTVNFINEDIDQEYINNLEKYITSELEPVSIIDAYYLEKEDWRVREVLWGVAKKYDYKTDNQYFKNSDQYVSELIQMFEREDKSWVKLFKQGKKNQDNIATQCNFEYDTDTRHLPKYIMTKEESESFKTNEDLFIHLVQKGFKEKNIKDPQKYINRLRVEIKVLKQGDVLDYFLSLYDIVRFAKREKMLTGIGRGSAGGSLVAYLLGIIQIDPLDFDLLFERFLNSGRMGEYQDRTLYDVELENKQVIKLPEGSLVSIERGDRETAVFIQDLKEGDNYIKH